MTRGRRSFAWVGVVLGVLFVGVAAALLWTVASTQPTDSGNDAQGAEERRVGVEAKAFADYSWSELAQVAQLIAAAETNEAAQEVAAAYNVEVGAAHGLELADGAQATATVVGIAADAGSGITFMTSPIASRAMNSTATNVGGWESSELRGWLASDGLGLLPEELGQSIVAVEKLTNNVGVTSDAASVTATTDKLWLFSGSEVCGTLTWFTSEYGSTPNAHTDYTDFAAYDAMLSAEGSQYAYFAAAGVTSESDASGILAMTYGGKETAWWYRTSYPYSFTGDDASFFFQVMASGFPSSVGQADQEAGVVVGFCL